MPLIHSEAWTLQYDGSECELIKKEISFPEIGADEIVARPLYGCLEGNMVHAMRMDPENVFLLRNEKEIIPGNSGVVAVERVGEEVSNVKAGDLCIYFCNGEADPAGYPIKILAYDKPGSMGVFSKKIKLHSREVIKIPDHDNGSLPQWAAFSLKYITAWSNWKIAHGSWKLQMSRTPDRETYVFGWGGGVSFAELTLARMQGCPVSMITSQESRLEFLEKNGIKGFLRSGMKKGEFEERFLSHVRDFTSGKGASVFIDNIGRDVYNLTLKALGRQGIIATSGWKSGGMLPVVRASECQNRHIHVFTHYASYEEGVEAVDFAHENGWLPPEEGKVYEWDDLPSLLEDYAGGKIESYFPVYKINDLNE